MNTASTSGSGTLPGNTIANLKGKLKAITTRSGLATEGPTVPNPPKSVNPEEDECVEETYTDPDHAEYTIKVPPPPSVQKPKPPIQRNFVLHTRDSLPPISSVILKKLPEKLGDPGKFLILCGFSELKCKALADLGASINLMPLDNVLPSPDNEDKVFILGIQIHEKLVKIITRFAQEKKLAVSFASLLFEDFDPLFYERLVFKEVLNSIRLLLFSSENEEKVFKPGIYTSKKVHYYCFLSELSHPGYLVFKVNLIFIILMRIFHVQSGKNTPPLDVLLFHFYPP
nr:reverse transcriptase domain-containing protein [Tanacetum cinerariifolium]